jgi:hypothetical protein
MYVASDMQNINDGFSLLKIRRFHMARTVL